MAKYWLTHNNGDKKIYSFYPLVRCNLKMNELKFEFEKYIEANQLGINQSNFTTIENAYTHSLRFELGDQLKNGTKVKS